ncbi:MAG: protein-ADP-ribose hydrolase [Bacteroidales bacterium]|nr:protein-ADP-ribose hydrolase [Bacteroidales bacterium]
MDRIENIDFCIRYLLQQDKVEAVIPSSLAEKQQLLRALMNVWQPQPLSDEFFRAQNAELQAQLADKGIVEVEENLWHGDITQLKVDAIVNAANSRGLGCWHPLHACIDNAIHSAAGLQLRQACNNILRGGEIDTGDAIITPGYNLPSKYVIHTVGPIIATGNPTPEQERQLANCYRNCLELAETNGCRSIVFCCISTGEFRFPNRRAAEIAVEACRGAKTKVIFNVFKDIDYAIYRQLLGKD